MAVLLIRELKGAIRSLVELTSVEDELSFLRLSAKSPEYCSIFLKTMLII
jgi:hypothetical protein